MIPLLYRFNKPRLPQDAFTVFHSVRRVADAKIKAFQ
jgi:hypothetical protein